MTRENGRVRLGSWTCPSGNNVIAYYRPASNGLASFDLEWDSPPPLTPEDADYYRSVIRPAMIGRVAEWLEKPTARALVIEP